MDADAESAVAAIATPPALPAMPRAEPAGMRHLAYKTAGRM